MTSWNALYAPAGTPQPIIDKLNGALREVLADPDLKKRALDLGIEAKGSTPAEMDARMRSDIDKWTKVIESANIPKFVQDPKRNRRPDKRNRRLFGSAGNDPAIQRDRTVSPSSTGRGFRRPCWRRYEC